MRNRGTVVVLAVIFLAIFAVLGISLFSMGSTSVQVAHNNRQSQEAMAAAESGMAFLQRAIGDIRVPEVNATGLGIMQRIATKLSALNNTATLDGQSITVSSDSASISIPAFKPHAGSRQRVSARIALNPADLAATRPPLTLSVTGASQTGTISSNYQRTISIHLVPRDRALQLFSYGVFSRGSIFIDNNKTAVTGDPTSAGSIGSSYTDGPAIVNNGGTIGGDIFVSGDPEELVTIAAGSVGGLSGDEAWDNVHEVPPPDIPTFDPNKYYQSNLRVINSKRAVSGTMADVCFQPPSGLNSLSIKFAGGQVLQGLIYVKPGVTLDFSGGAQVQGVIVVENPGPGQVAGKLTFTGSPMFTDPVWPVGSVVSPAVQAELNGYSVLGPSATIEITGNTSTNDPNAGFAGTVVCGTFRQDGSASVKIRDGTLIVMSTTGPATSDGYSAFFSGDGVLIERSASYTAPFTGTTHYFSWVVDRMTYQEPL